MDDGTAVIYCCSCHCSVISVVVVALVGGDAADVVNTATETAATAALTPIQSVSITAQCYNCAVVKLLLLSLVFTEEQWSMDSWQFLVCFKQQQLLIKRLGVTVVLH